jgi:hypothetical protein
MTFKNCVACGAQRIIWDLDKQGKCEGGCEAHAHSVGALEETVVPLRTVKVGTASAPINGFHVDKSIRNYVGRLQEKYGFDKPEDGSENRYDERRERQPALRHRFWWFVHNAVAHPLIAIVPRHFAFEFHDWTSRKLHGK